MKELSIEEKAKAYDDAIKKAESLYNETKKEELAQKYMDYISERHGISQYSKEWLLVFYAYIHGMNACLKELKTE